MELLKSLLGLWLLFAVWLGLAIYNYDFVRRHDLPEWMHLPLILIWLLAGVLWFLLFIDWRIRRGSSHDSSRPASNPEEER